jgi:alpha-galactosidase
MAQITIIGAGSRVFAEAMIRDSLTFPALADSTFRLMDIDEEALDIMATIARKLIKQGGHGATVTTTTDRREALEGADYVVVSILSHGREPIRPEIDIPMKYGVSQCIGDTMGPGGIFRGLRTIPHMLEIAWDMEELCPDAVMLNYTNPMSLLCHAVREVSDVEIVGLCHSVQGAHAELARQIDEDPGECASWIAGINHTAWVLEYMKNGEDLYPRLRQAARDNEGWYEANTTRVEMFRQFGYYVTESSGHNSEYNPWFRKREDLRERYCSGPRFHGQHGYIKDIYPLDKAAYRKAQIEEARKEEIKSGRGHEYGAYIMNAHQSGEPFRFNGTVANDGLITNLPDGCSVEVPIYVDRSGLHPCFVGDLPGPCAALNNMQVQSLLLACEAALTGDRETLFHAVAFDPLSAAVLSLEEIRNMTDELYEADKDMLPMFEGGDAGATA